jgi:uncharacterized CHY-type Zn-finger protein
MMMQRSRNSREAECLGFLLERLTWHLNRILEADTTIQAFIHFHDMKAVIHGSKHLDLSFNLIEWFESAAQHTPGINPVPDMQVIEEFLLDANPRHVFGLKKYYPTTKCCNQHPLEALSEAKRQERKTSYFVCDVCSHMVTRNDACSMMYCESCNYGVCLECQHPIERGDFDVVKWIHSWMDLAEREKAPAGNDEKCHDERCNDYMSHDEKLQLRDDKSKAIAACRPSIDAAKHKYTEWPVCRFILLGLEGSVFESDCWSYERTFRVGESDDFLSTAPWTGLARCFGEVIRIGRLDQHKFDRAHKNTNFAKGMARLTAETLPHFMQLLVNLKSVLNSNAGTAIQMKAKIAAGCVTVGATFGQALMERLGVVGADSNSNVAQNASHYI